MKKMITNIETRKLISNISMSVAIKGGSLIIALLSTPLYIKYFNDDIALGLWFTLYSMLSWMLNFDLGIGNGLRNKLAVALSKNDKKRAGSLIFSSYLMSLIFLLLVFCIYLIFHQNINWYSILNIAPEYQEMNQLIHAIDIVVISILLQMLLRTINYIYYAEQKPNVNNFTALVTSITIVLYLIFAELFARCGSIVEIAYVNLAAVNVPLIVVTIAYIIKNNYLIKEKFIVNRKTINSVLGLGLKFFYVQIVYMVVASSNEFFINYCCSSADVVEYSIYNRLFTIIGMAVGVLVVPVWSAITKAIAEKKYEWIKKMYFSLILVGLASVIFNAVLGVLSQVVFNIWLGGETRIVNYTIVWFFAFYGAAISMTSILSAFANGMGKIGVQALCYSIIALIKIVFANSVTSTFGWVGVIMISTIGLWIFVIIQYIVTYKEIKKYRNIR